MVNKFAYYNEFDGQAATWTRELIKAGLIAPGEVDERSITDVEPNDLKGFVQHHFFSGICGWSYALRLAGWADTRPVCTASLPCQPFSVAGKGKGKEDERHLLPYFLSLVKECGFNTIFGEQVEGAIKYGWLEDLQAAMEAEDYAFGYVVLGAHSAGAPHIRQRLYWVADRVAHTSSERHTQQPDNRGIPSKTAGNDERESIERSGELCGMVYPDGTRSQQGRELTEITGYRDTTEPTSSNEWDKPEWIYCRDNKYRPIKPSIKPLANRVPKGVVRGGDTSEPINADDTQEARVMRIKCYGNSIVPQIAAQFIHAFMQV
jgi:DNA (cytosine-5)-methyltransferase 1